MSPVRVNSIAVIAWKWQHVESEIAALDINFEQIVSLYRSRDD